MGVFCRLALFHPMAHPLPSRLPFHFESGVYPFFTDVQIGGSTLVVHTKGLQVTKCLY